MLLVMGHLAGAQDGARIWLDPLSGIGYDASQDYASNVFGAGMPGLSEVGVGWSFRSEDSAFLPQYGDGESMGFFDARSVLRLDSLTAVKGEVYYHNGKKRNVLLNESSDWELLRPYVLADTVGGDMSKEEYFFRGLWSRRLGKVQLGVEGKFRALHEYRDVDPRPRDISSDFYARISAGVPAAGHILTLSGSYRKYHQSESLEFLNQSGANTSVFHLTGLGGTFARFTSTGTFLGTRHRGQGFGVSLLFSPASGWESGASALDRLTAGLSFSQISIVQHLKAQNEAPITRSTIRTSEGFAALRGNIGSLRYGLEAKGSYEWRVGTEDVINNVMAGTFDNLLSMKMFSESEAEASVRMLMETADGWNFGPSVLWHSSDAKHLFPRRSMDWSLIGGGVSGGRMIESDKWLASISAEAFWTSSLGGSFERKEVDLKDDPTYFDEDIWGIYDTMNQKFTDNRLSAGLSARVQRKVSQSLSVFVSASGWMIFFGSGDKSEFATISAGVCF